MPLALTFLRRGQYYYRDSFTVKIVKTFLEGRSKLEGLDLTGQHLNDFAPTAELCKGLGRSHFTLIIA